MRKVQNQKSPEPTYIGERSTVPVNADSLEGMKPDDDRMVAGIFKNLECPGQPAYVACRLYKGQGVFSRHFFDGELATIPLSVAKYINTRIGWQKYDWQADGDGGFKKQLKTVVQRYQFNSREFM